jgi:hypothetical protein
MTVSKCWLRFNHTAHLASSCGLSLKIFTEQDGILTEKSSTIGGLIRVDGIVYGLTTAHSILSNQGKHLDEDDDIDSFPSPEFDSENASSSPLRPRDSTTAEHSSKSLTHFDFDESDDITSETFELGPISYGCHGSLRYLKNLVSSSLTSDFALVKFPSSLENRLENRFRPPGKSGFASVHKFARDHSSGAVYVLQDINHPKLGHLVDGTSTIMQRDAVLETRTIQLDSPLGIHSFQVSLMVYSNLL